MTSIVEIRVHMDCAGCERKIKKALQKIDGVDNVEIDMSNQKVTLTGWLDQKKVLKTVRKTGRKAELWPFPYNPEFDNYAHYYYDEYSRSPATHMFTQSSSSYNYRKHGYCNQNHGYNQELPHSTIVEDEAGSMFNDDNVNACSIM
ncbi:hypothetical protein Leryth_025841 [Lithospermum erythrorhizon]|nr:hypothetical protein Leryth_025841 [Lithospermum erythrorhizon]